MFILSKAAYCFIENSLLTLEGQDWRDRRVKLSPIFTSGKMKMMFESVDSIGERLIDVLNVKTKTSGMLEMRELAAQYTSDVIGNVAFGLDCKCWYCDLLSKLYFKTLLTGLEDPNSEFLKYGRRLFDLTAYEAIKFFITVGFPDLCRKLHVVVNAKESTDFFLNTFLQTFEYREKNKIKRNDFVSMLLSLKDSFTPSELAAEGFLVFAAGFETSSTLVTFTLYELALNPDIQKRLRDEIKTGLDENGGKLSYDLLFGFKYLDMVVNESLRKFPPIPSSIRKCNQEYKIPGTDLIVPEGTPMELPVYSLQHDPEYFPEPEKFDPERFSPEKVEARNPFTFLPFGEGPRNCIGMRFGMMQSKVAIVKLLQNYELSTCDKTTIPMKFVPSSPFLAPVGGMWLELKKIN